MKLRWVIEHYKGWGLLSSYILPVPEGEATSSKGLIMDTWKCEEITPQPIAIVCLQSATKNEQTNMLTELAGKSAILRTNWVLQQKADTWSYYKILRNIKGQAPVLKEFPRN